MPRLSEIIAALNDHYPPELAESWDAVGLVCGDPGIDVRRVLFAVDPVAAVADEAISWGADLIVTHHPLFLRPVNSVAATTPKGALVHTLITRSVALFTAHTNADRANPGVNDALAEAIRLRDVQPLVPLENDSNSNQGLGRVGTLEDPLSLEEFAARVSQALPSTAAGVKVAGDARRMVRRVAVCGGAGDSLLGRVRELDVDAYVTADLRHHPATESIESGGPALVDVTHWASEWLWLPEAADRLVAQFTQGEATVETRVSVTPTDPWTLSWSA